MRWVRFWLPFVVFCFMVLDRTIVLVHILTEKTCCVESNLIFFSFQALEIASMDVLLVTKAQVTGLNMNVFREKIVMNENIKQEKL